MAKQKLYGEAWIRGNSLGEGGQARVYEAKPANSPDDKYNYAIKILDQGKNRKARTRFHLESQALQLLDHPGLAEIIDSNASDFENHDTELYIVMRRIYGTKLSKIELPLDIQTSIDYTIRILNAIKHAHDRGVVHRDIKPDNIILRPSNTDLDPVIVDFGISTDLDRDRIQSITDVDDLVGNRFMICPESVYDCADRYTASMDLMQCSAILFYLLTGLKPNAWRDRDGNPPHRRIVAIEKLSNHPLGIRSRLDDYFTRAFIESPLHRWPTAESMIRYLAPLSSEQDEYTLSTSDRLANLVSLLGQHNHFEDSIVLDEMSLEITSVLENFKSTIEKSDKRFQLIYHPAEQYDHHIRIQCSLMMTARVSRGANFILEIKLTDNLLRFLVQESRNSPTFILVEKSRDAFITKQELEEMVFDITDNLLRQILETSSPKLNLHPKYKELPQKGLFGDKTTVFGGNS